MLESRDVVLERRPSESPSPTGRERLHIKAKSQPRLGGFSFCMKLMTHMSVFLIIVFFGNISWYAWEKMYPRFGPAAVGSQMFSNVVKFDDTLLCKLWVGIDPFPVDPPLANFSFKYSDVGFEAHAVKAHVDLSAKALSGGNSVYLSAEVIHQSHQSVATRAWASVLRTVPVDEHVTYHLLNDDGADVCVSAPEPFVGPPQRKLVARGLPAMQLRLVYDTAQYPESYITAPYMPVLYVDSFLVSNNDLIRLNVSAANSFDVDVSFDLISAPRWRLEKFLELALQPTVETSAGEESSNNELRDIFANTNSYLIAAVFLVSFLHIIFDVLAFRNDVIFFQNIDAATLNKYVSVNGILANIVMNVFIVLYLCEEGGNVLVIAPCFVSIVVDIWKVRKAWFAHSSLPVDDASTLASDDKAMWVLTNLLAPVVLGYGFYSLRYNCYRSWYSFAIHFSASCVYTGGFVLLTPQVFLNYKNKTVAYLPWSKLIYRFLNTIIDDVFAFLIQMPVMHRVACFRDDIIFVIYLWQWFNYDAVVEDVIGI